jgi:hypothetical protein
MFYHLSGALHLFCPEGSFYFLQKWNPSFILQYISVF